MYGRDILPIYEHHAQIALCIKQYPNQHILTYYSVGSVVKNVHFHYSHRIKSIKKIIHMRSLSTH
jgi:hypothetical protein